MASEMYLVLMKQVHAFSQILSSSGSAASCCSSVSPSSCSSVDSHLCGGHDPRQGKYSRSHQTMRANHLFFIYMFVIRGQKAGVWTGNKVSPTCGCFAFQQLQTRLSQVVPVPGVEGQQVTQLLQTQHCGSHDSKMLVDGDLQLKIQIKQ